MLFAEALAEKRNHVSGVRVAPDHRLREDQLAVEVDVEDPPFSGHDLDRVDDLLPVLEDVRDQTGRVRQRPSGDAVLDPDAVCGGHRSQGTR